MILIIIIYISLIKIIFKILNNKVIIFYIIVIRLSIGEGVYIFFSNLLIIYYFIKNIKNLITKFNYIN